MDMITSTSNPLIKQVRALRLKKTRVATKTFLVEGIHHVGEAVQAGWDIEIILYAPELLTSDFAKELLQKTQEIKLQPVSVNVMEALADKENPQGILAVVKQKNFSFDNLKINNAVALVSPQDPGNLGTILRTMDAVNVDALFLLDGGVELYHPTVIRASMGTIFWKPIIQTSFDDFVAWSKNKSIQLIGTSAKADVGYQTLVPQTPWVLVLGNEQKGLTKEQVDACDVTVSIPMQGRVSSLNLSVAAGVLLYQFSIDHEKS
ncbi:MAG: RNA methyltransferase [Anaerolineales bacterium]|nr:RNA methyltransferase [Anaerolineales bacterium]MBX3035478.1 RNA methyltransferase [Anaerolineales bacterium]